MSSEPLAPSPDVPLSLPTLHIHERRVLGVLVEKAKTTPDAYPLSLNGLTTGCNQKSNRDPVLAMTDLEVEEALAGCQKNLLAFRITGGGRVERWKHNLYEAWKVEKVELAVVAELMLRGPQTEGELRVRAGRMEPISDLNALREVLQSLAQRRLVLYLTPEGRRGTTVTHGFHPPKELERLRSKHPIELTDDYEPLAATSAQLPSGDGPAPPPASQSPEIQIQLATLQAQVASLQSTVANLEQQLRGLKESLGA